MYLKFLKQIVSRHSSPEGEIHRCIISPDRTMVALSGPSILLYHLSRDMGSYIGQGPIRPNQIVFSHNGHYLAYLDQTRILFLYHLKKQRQDLIAINCRIFCFGTDDQDLWVTNGDTTLLRYHLPTEHSDTYHLPFDPSVLVPSGHSVYVCNSRGQILQIEDHLPEKFSVVYQPERSGVCDPPGESICVLWLSDKLICVTHTMIEIHDPQRHKVFTRTNMTYNPHIQPQMIGEEILVYSPDPLHLILWNYLHQTLQTLLTTTPIECVVVLDDKKLLFVCSGIFQIWNFSTNQITPLDDPIFGRNQHFERFSPGFLISNEGCHSFSLWEFT